MDDLKDIAKKIISVIEHSENDADAIEFVSQIIAALNTRASEWIPVSEAEKVFGPINYSEYHRNLYFKKDRNSPDALIDYQQQYVDISGAVTFDELKIIYRLTISEPKPGM